MLRLGHILRKAKGTGATFPDRKYLLRNGVIPGFQGWLYGLFPAYGALLIMDHAGGKVGFFGLWCALGQGLLISEAVYPTIVLVQIKA